MQRGTFQEKQACVPSHRRHHAFLSFGVYTSALAVQPLGRGGLDFRSGLGLTERSRRRCRPGTQLHPWTSDAGLNFIERKNRLPVGNLPFPPLARLSQPRHTSSCGRPAPIPSSSPEMQTCTGKGGSRDTQTCTGESGSKHRKMWSGPGRRGRGWAAGGHQASGSRFYELPGAVADEG